MIFIKVRSKVRPNAQQCPNRKTLQLLNLPTWVNKEEKLTFALQAAEKGRLSLPGGI